MGNRGEVAPAMETGQLTQASKKQQASLEQPLEQLAGGREGVESYRLFHGFPQNRKRLV